MWRRKRKMRTEDYDQSIMALDAEMVDILEKMDELDKTSEEYGRAAQNLKAVQASKHIEVRNKNEHRSGMFPQWACWGVGAVASIFLGERAIRVQLKDGLFPTQAMNFWEKFRPRF